MKRCIVAAGLILGALILGLSVQGVPIPPNVRVTNIPQLNNEEQVVICPTDSNVVIAVWRDFRLGFRQIGIGRSTDGGQTWTDSLIERYMQYFGTSSWQSDPTLTADRMGNFYISVLDYINGYPGSSTISFYKSTDKGLSWSGPFTTPFPANSNDFEDKQFITTDRTGGLYDGNVYVAWARFYEPLRIMFARSTDGGMTFDTVRVRGPLVSAACGYSNTGNHQFANPMVSSDGAVHVFWEGQTIDSLNGCSTYTAIGQRTSYDGGTTFGPEKTLTQCSGWTTADGGIATYSAPVGDADITNGPYRGNMYIAYTNIEAGVVEKSDIDFIRSTDNGLTWSSPIQINDDANTWLIDNFHPWLVVNEEGVLITVFYDQRYDVTYHYSFDLNAAYSFDGGQTFTTNHRISSVSSSPDNLRIPYQPDDTSSAMSAPLAVMNPMAGKIGEYVGVSAFHDKVNAVWTDARDGNQEVYSATWQLPVMTPRLSYPANQVHVKGSAGWSPMPMLKWATSWKHDSDLYRITYTGPFGIGGSKTTTMNWWAGWAGDPPMPTIYPEGWYYWKVKTYKSDMSDSSDWSPTWSFYMDLTAPTTPNTLLPTFGSSTSDRTPTFKWTMSSDASGPVRYELKVSADSTLPEGPSTFVYDAGTATIIEWPTELALGTYYWKVTATDAVGWYTLSDRSKFTIVPPCCVGTTGNVNCSGIIDLSDLSVLVCYLTCSSKPTLCCAEAANVNGTGIIDLTDLSLLIAYLLNTPRPMLPNCP